MSRAPEINRRLRDAIEGVCPDSLRKRATAEAARPQAPARRAAARRPAVAGGTLFHACTPTEILTIACEASLVAVCSGNAQTGVASYLILVAFSLFARYFPLCGGESWGGWGGEEVRHATPWGARHIIFSILLLSSIPWWLKGAYFSPPFANALPWEALVLQVIPLSTLSLMALLPQTHNNAVGELRLLQAAVVLLCTGQWRILLSLVLCAEGFLIMRPFGWAMYALNFYLLLSSALSDYALSCGGALLSFFFLFNPVFNPHFWPELGMLMSAGWELERTLEFFANAVMFFGTAIDSYGNATERLRRIW